MRISILSIGVFVSILFINSVFANTVVANRTHVNNANASMQNKMQATGTKVATRTCAAWLNGQEHTDANCLLWNLSEAKVYARCTKNSDCAWITVQCNPGQVGRCDSGTGKCYCGSR